MPASPPGRATATAPVDLVEGGAPRNDGLPRRRRQDANSMSSSSRQHFGQQRGVRRPLRGQGAGQTSTFWGVVAVAPPVDLP